MMGVGSSIGGNNFGSTSGCGNCDYRSCNFGDNTNVFRMLLLMMMMMMVMVMRVTTIMMIMMVMMVRIVMMMMMMMLLLLWLFSC